MASHRVRCYLLAMFVYCATLGIVNATPLDAPDVPPQVEVFSTSDLEIDGKPQSGTQAAIRNMDIQVYQLDGIQRIEAKLSKGLTADP